jgi:glycosyltransferase involved in cell wall biosynthesis
MVSEHASPLAVLGGVDAGGQNVHVAALATALACRGHEVTVYTRRDSAALPRSIELAAGVEVEHLDAGPAHEISKDQLLPHIPALTLELGLRLRETRPDVVHAHFWMSGLASTAAAQPLDIPVVQTFHALGAVKRRHQKELDTSPSARIDHERALARNVDRLIASCSDERQELIRLGGDPASIDIVPSGVDLERFSVRGPVAPHGRLRRLLVVSRLVPRKGVDDAIRMLEWLADAELVVAGGPESGDLSCDDEATRLSQLAKELEVSERVHLLGRVAHDQLPALIRSADLMICLPWYEPFGIVPLEAMACGVPVVGSAVGGLLDTVDHEHTGVLLPPHSPLAAARAARRLLDDDRLRRRMGRAGRRRAVDYSWDAVAAAAEQTYRTARAGRRSAFVVRESVGHA